MWQDTVLSGVQAVLALALIPSILDRQQKPAVSTSLINTVAMVAIIVVYFSLHFWWSTVIATVVCLEWAALAMQRYQLDRATYYRRPNIPFKKLLGELFGN